MNLRQRGSKSDFKADMLSDDDDDVDEDVDEIDDYESRRARYKQPLSKGNYHKLYSISTVF